MKTVSQLARRVFQECVAEFQSPEGQQEFQRFSAPEALMKRHDMGCVTFVAEEHDEIVGMLHRRDEQHIAMLFIERRYQKKGIGRGLVRLAEEQARRSRQCVDAITVAASPNAIEAYRRLGFVPVGTEQTVKGLQFLTMRLALDLNCGNR